MRARLAEMILAPAVLVKNIKDAMGDKKLMKTKYAGLLEIESLKNPRIVNRLTVRKVWVEHHPDSVDSKYWHVCRVEIMSQAIERLTKYISRSMKYGWYALFRNDKEILIVFSNRIFRLPRKKYHQSKEFKQMREYGLKHGVQVKYLESLRIR